MVDCIATSVQNITMNILFMLIMKAHYANRGDSLGMRLVMHASMQCHLTPSGIGSSVLLACRG